jgi:PAS domain S-box-containing protein
MDSGVDLTNNSDLHMAMDAIVDAFYMIGPDWRFRFFNRSAEKFFGYNRDDIVGLLYTEAWPGVENSAPYHAVKKVMISRKEYTDQMQSYVRPECTVLFSAVPLEDGGVAVTVRDISKSILDAQALAEANLRLNGVLQSTNDCVVMLDHESRITFANSRALEFMQRDETVYGTRLIDVFPTIVNTKLIKYFNQANEDATSVPFMHYISSMDRWIDVTLYPSEKGITVFFRDVTDTKKNEERLADSERQFRELANSMPQMVWKSDRGGNRYWFNQRWYQYTGLTASKARGWGWLKACHPDDVESLKSQLRESFIGKTSWEVTYRIRDTHNNYRWFLVRAVPVLDAKHQVVRWLGTDTDVTAEIKDKEHQQLLLHELNHRVKNTLAIIQSIARQTTGDTPSDFRLLFENRLLALSKTHDLLTDSDWASAPLRELICKELAPYVYVDTEVRKYVLEGPDVKLKPQVVVPLGMAIHELATNAAKYGALTNPEGVVNITWALVDSNIVITWRESGGPIVRAPSRKGFGTRLLQHSFRGDFGGAVRTTYEPTGIVCVMEIPAAHIVDDQDERKLFRIKKQDDSNSA